MNNGWHKWLMENSKWLITLLAGSIVAFAVAQTSIADNQRRIEAIEARHQVQPSNQELRVEINEVQRRLDRIEDKVDRLIEMR